MSKQKQLTNDERDKLSQANRQIDYAMSNIRDVLNSSGSINTNEKLRIIYGILQKQRAKLPAIVETK